MTTKKAIIILITAIGIVILYLFLAKMWLKNIDPDVSQAAAEMIAAPVLQECWGDEGFTIISYSSELINKGNVWRVGANYTSEELQGQVISTSNGEVPEVFIHAYNGGILDRHFSEIGEPDNQNCASYGVTGELHSTWTNKMADVQPTYQQVLTELDSELLSAGYYGIEALLYENPTDPKNNIGIHVYKKGDVFGDSIFAIARPGSPRETASVYDVLRIENSTFCTNCKKEETVADICSYNNGIAVAVYDVKNTFGKVYAGWKIEFESRKFEPISDLENISCLRNPFDEFAG